MRGVTSKFPIWPLLGTVLFAGIFISFLLVYVPYTITLWHVSAPLFGWGGTRWIGVLLMLAAAPVIADFLVRYVFEGRGTPAPFAPPRRLVVAGSFAT